MTLGLESDVSAVARRQLGAMREALAFNFQIDEFEAKTTGQSVLRLWKPAQAAAVAVAKAQAQVGTWRPGRCLVFPPPPLSPFLIEPLLCPFVAPASSAPGVCAQKACEWPQRCAPRRRSMLISRRPR